MTTTSRQVSLGDPRAPLSIVTDGVPVRVQLCLSPHCSTVASLLEAASTNWWTAEPRGWQRIFRERSAGFDFTALAPYTAYPAVPRFLATNLDDPAPTFASQVREILETPHERVRRDVCEAFGDAVPRAYLPFIQTPRQALEALCAGLDAYWSAVVEPLWPRMRVTLEREILRQAYAFTTSPAERALARVHPAMSFDGDVLTIQSVAQETTTSLDSRVLMLTPLICAPDGLLADVAEHDRVKIGYAAPGASEVWDDPGHAPGPTSQLNGLLGRTRALILTAAAGEICTTGSLGTTLGLPAATVSEHLTALHGLGLLDRERVGRTVQYRLTSAGANLLELFEVDAAPH